MGGRRFGPQKFCDRLSNLSMAIHWFEVLCTPFLSPSPFSTPFPVFLSLPPPLFIRRLPSLLLCGALLSSSPFETNSTSYHIFMSSNQKPASERTSAAAAKETRERREQTAYGGAKAGLSYKCPGRRTWKGRERGGRRGEIMPGVMTPFRCYAHSIFPWHIAGPCRDISLSLLAA